VQPVGEGHSNVTYALRRDGTDVVLRRPPRGPLPPSAHDVLREARVLSALAGRARVPAVLAVCEDESVIGAPFYVMERVEGHVVTSSVPAALDSPDDRRRIGEELVDALVEVHAVDWRDAGLEGFGKPTATSSASCGRFLGPVGAQPHARHPGGRVGGRMARDAPARVRTGHRRPRRLPAGQHDDGPGAPARLVAIFDWEMATIGDPLADLGYLCTLWVDRHDPTGGMFELSGVTREEGFPLREELVARYEERSGAR
jgi:aminoglycoside phosphotransferase (APT) family kinase protein